MCLFHHEDFHEKYGKGKNTKEQFEEYRAIAEVLIKVANQESMINSASRRMLQQAERDQVVAEILADMEIRYGSDGYHSEHSSEEKDDSTD